MSGPILHSYLCHSMTSYLSLYCQTCDCQVVYNISWIMMFSVYGHGQCLFPAILCCHHRYRSGQNMMSWPNTIPQQLSSSHQVAAPRALYAHIRHRQTGSGEALVSYISLIQLPMSWSRWPLTGDLLTRPQLPVYSRQCRRHYISINLSTIIS